MIKDYDVDISENLEEIMKTYLLKDTAARDTSIRNNIAEKKLKHFRNMQRLARQDHELKELIAKTEEIILKSETQVEYSNEDICSLQEHLHLWSISLERIDERTPRSNDNKKNKENNNNGDLEIVTTEENESNNTENVTNIDETDTSDSRNWPQFVYELKGASRFKQRLCCVICAIPGSFNKNDIICEAADSYHLLDSSLELVDEQVISGLITIKPKEGKQILIEVPILVYIPIVPHHSALVPTVKYFRGDSWAVGNPIPSIKLSTVPNVSFVGTSIPVRDLVCLQCIAVARHRRQEIGVDEKGITYELKDDRNIKINIPPLTFSYTATVLTKVVSWNKIHIEKESDWNMYLKYIKTAGSYLEISSETVTEADLEVCLFNLGWFVDTEHQNRLSVNQETLHRCSRWLVSNMEPIETEHIRSLYEDVPEILQTKGTKGDKNRIILQDLKDSNDMDFDNFLESLKTSNQPNILTVLNHIKEKISSSRLQYEDGNTDNNFDTDYQLRQGKLYIILKTDEKDWTTLLHEAKPMNPKCRVITLPKGHCTYKIICLTSTEELTCNEIEKASCFLEELTYLTNVCIICRQNKEDLNDVIIQCVKSSQAEESHKELCERGYSEGPPISEEFGIIDGEEIEIRFDDNIIMKKYKLFPLQIKFFVNIEPLKISGRLDIVNTNDQGGDGTYHGRLLYKVPQGRFTKERMGFMEIHFPKKLETDIDNFMFTANDPVKVLAKHVSWLHTCDNSYSTRWVTYAGYLVERDMPMYRQIIKDIDEENSYTSQKERCEAFILRWAKECDKSEADKIKRILDALTDKDKQNDAQRFVEKYLPPNGFLTNHSIKQIGFIVARDWKVISERLGFSRSDTGKIISTENGLVRQSVRMLDLWRISDTVVLTSVDVLESLSDATRDLECHFALLDYIKDYRKVFSEQKQVEIDFKSNKLFLQ